jgi:predicted O-methyltransferase YrrM
MSSFKVEIARESFKKAGLSGLITQIEGDILKVLSTWNTKIDMVFIDADKYDYLKYIKKLESSLNNGAVIVADNMTNFANEVKNYVKYMNRGSKYVSQFVGIEDGLLLSIYKNN